MNNKKVFYVKTKDYSVVQALEDADIPLFLRQISDTYVVGMNNIYKPMAEKVILDKCVKQREGGEIEREVKNNP